MRPFTQNTAQIERIDEVVIPLKLVRNNLEPRRIHLTKRNINQPKIICTKENAIICIAFLFNCLLIGFLTYFMLTYQFSVPVHEAERTTETPAYTGYNWICNASSDIRSYVKPNLLTALHEPTSACEPLALSDMKSIRNASSNSRSCKEPIYALIIVFSETNKFDNRDAIRKTWGNVSFFEEDKVHRVRVIFALGMSLKIQTQDEVTQESKLYGDILQESFVDSYNTSIKTIMTFKWILRFKQSVRYILKTDDETQVNIYNLLKLLKEQDVKYNSTNVFLGTRLSLEAPNLTEKKWNVPFCLMGRQTNYPPFFGANGYIMSIATVEKIYKAALNTLLFPVEPIFIGFCASAAGVQPMECDTCITNYYLADNVCTFVKYIISQFGRLHKKAYLTPQETIKYLNKCKIDVNQKLM